MKIRCLVIILLLIVCFSEAQTNPTAQALPYALDFSSLQYTSTTYPAGIQGWQITNAPGSSFNTASPAGDKALQASRSAATTTNGIHNYQGKIGFLNDLNNDLSIVFALDTSGKQNITVNYTIMTIRNPYGTSGNSRINEVTLQYRVGTTGSFANLTGIEYQNNTTTQVSGTTPQQPLDKSIVLPAACNNQANVQLRLASREVSGTGSRPSFAIDNISVTGDELLPIELSSFTVGLDHQSHARLTWITQSETGVLGFYVLRADGNNLAEAVTVSPLIPATNTSQQQSYVFTDEDLCASGDYYYWLQNSDLDGASDFHGPVIFHFDPDGNGPTLDMPRTTQLHTIYPNPFNPLAYISYSLATSSQVSIRIFSSRGQLVRYLDLGTKAPGNHSIQWDGRDSLGQNLASGIYCVQLNAGKDICQRKAVLMK